MKQNENVIELNSGLMKWSVCNVILSDKDRNKYSNYNGFKSNLKYNVI